MFCIVSQPEGANDSEGLQGLKDLGVRELHYRIAFLACSVVATNPRVYNFSEMCSCIAFVSVYNVLNL